jgi:23S rRNA (uracil1939-C5)-methyltransferase
MMRPDRDTPEQLLTRIVDSTAERVAPQCRHFGICGGCQLQHLPYTEQMAAKQAMLLDLMHQGGLRDQPSVTTHVAEPWQYRNRARMRIEASGTEAVQIGYYQRASHAFLAIEECPIVSPLIWQTATAVRDLVRQGKAKLPVGGASFELFANGDESALQLSFQLDTTVATVDRDAPRDLRSLCDALRMQIPQLIGAGLSVGAVPDPSKPRRVQETERVEIARWGDAALRYQVAGRDYTITRNAFFQVNRFLTRTMVETVLGNRTGVLAWDIFAGAGLFSVPLAERFDRVIAVEIGEPAASDLAAHLRASGPQHVARRSTALDFLREQTKKAARSQDLIVLDPPRAGLGTPTVQALLQAGAQEIVYVSCDAGTFTRDAKPLVESGYALTELHLLDLFPQTFHTETIAVFRR